jgi:hypothetical protein
MVASFLDNSLSAPLSALGIPLGASNSVIDEKYSGEKPVFHQNIFHLSRNSKISKGFLSLVMV